MKLTLEEYVDRDQQTCPRCLSCKTAKGGSYFPSGLGCISITIRCYNCSKQWAEKYELICIKELDGY